MVNTIREHISSYWLGASGITAASVSATPVLHTSDYLTTHTVGSLSYAEWMQVGGFIYVMVLLTLAIIKLVGKIKGKDNAQ